MCRTVLCPANLLVRTPDGQSDVEAAATWMQFVTAYAIRAYRRIEPGDAVIITAASSSVGLAAIQLVKADGGVPIAVTRGRRKVEALKRHGASHVIVSDEQDVAQAVREITDGRVRRSPSMQSPDLHFHRSSAPWRRAASQSSTASRRGADPVLCALRRVPRAHDPRLQRASSGGQPEPAARGDRVYPRRIGERSAPAGDRPDIRLVRDRRGIRTPARPSRSGRS